MSAHCSEVLSPSADLPGVRFLRIVERVQGFILQRFDERGDSMGDLQFETLDEAMRHVYSEYKEVSDWRSCSDDASNESEGRVGYLCASASSRNGRRWLVPYRPVIDPAVLCAGLPVLCADAQRRALASRPRRSSSRGWSRYRR
jgi:hypothetical protein